MISEKSRKILRYIGWTVISIFIALYVIYKINPNILTSLGIDITLLAKYTIAFFVIKGTITSTILLYGAWMLRKKLKK